MPERESMIIYQNLTLLVKNNVIESIDIGMITHCYPLINFELGNIKGQSEPELVIHACKTELFGPGGSIGMGDWEKAMELIREEKL